MNRFSFARRYRLAAVLVAAALASSAAVAPAQESVPGPTEAAAVEVQTIPLAEVTDRAEVAIAELAAVLPDDGARADLRTIQDRSQQLAADVAARVASAEATLAGSANLRRLREVELQLPRGLSLEGRDWKALLLFDLETVATLP